jgi:hypothetical protein
METVKRSFENNHSGHRDFTLGRSRSKIIVLFISLGLLAWGGLSPVIPASLSISNRYSPKNKRRPVRPETRYIILHTTEGAERGSLSKVRRRGEAHYFVTEKGVVYRVIDKTKIATHAGRSMWEGHKIIDNFSIGVEVVGYHNKDITDAQYVALRELIRQLKSFYKVADENVLTHSMVAYGRPNKFHRYYHRGRKRCGMIFARWDVRERLGLLDKPLTDPDVKAGRLRVADRELYRYLFAKDTRPKKVADAAGGQLEPPEGNVITRGWSAWTIAREDFDSPQTVYIFPDGTRKTGDQVQNWSRIPVGTQVILEQEAPAGSFEGFLEIGKDGDSPQALAGDAYDDATTIYFFKNGLVRTGEELAADARIRTFLEHPPDGTRVLIGYVYGGHVKSRRPPSRIAGRKWNYPSTFYRLPDGRIVSGDEIDEDSIPENTLVFYQA